MSAELKPCPFCGSTDVRFMGSFDDRGGVAVYCMGAGCDCTMGANWDRDALPDHAYRDEEQAAEAWNRRATPAPGAPGQEAAAVRKDSLTTQAAAVQAVAQETDRDWSKAQDWKGMDGATAFLLINRHSDGWGDVGAMMNAWLAANAATPAAVQAVGAWQDIATAPEDVLVIVGWRDEEDAENPDRHMFDYREDGVWANYFSEHEHYAIAGVAHGRSEDAPYTHWMAMGPVPAALPPSGAREKP